MASKTGRSVIERTTLRATPVRALSWDFRLADGDRDLGLLDLEVLRSRARFEVDDITYEIVREGLLAGRYALSCGGRTVAHCERTSLVPHESMVTGEDRRLSMRRVFGLRLLYRVLHGDREIGAIRRPSMFRRTIELELIDPTPLPLRLFLLTLAIFHMRQRARSRN
jgi:hypothetical protein